MGADEATEDELASPSNRDVDWVRESSERVAHVYVSCISPPLSLLREDVVLVSESAGDLAWDVLYYTSWLVHTSWGGPASSLCGQDDRTSDNNLMITGASLALVAPVLQRSSCVHVLPVADP